MNRRKTCSRYEAELPEFQRENPASKAELQMETTELKRQLERSNARMQSKIMPMQSKITQLERQNSGEVVMQRASSLHQSLPHRCERLWWQIGSAMSRSC